MSQVLIDAGKDDNFPKRRFIESICPHLTTSPKFKKMLAAGARALPDGSIAYRVDGPRMMNVMDGICQAINFTKYDEPFDNEIYGLNHLFQNFHSAGQEDQRLASSMIEGLRELVEKDSWAIEGWEADKVDEEVYSYKMISPVGSNGSFQSFIVFIAYLRSRDGM